MTTTELDTLTAQLTTELDRSGDNIGDLMAKLRKRLKAARDADDETAEAAAELLYLLASQVQFERQKIRLKAIVDSPGIQEVIKALSAANRELKDEIDDLADLEKGISTARKAISYAEIAVKKAAALVA